MQKSIFNVFTTEKAALVKRRNRIKDPSFIEVKNNAVVIR